MYSAPEYAIVDFATWMIVAKMHDEDVAAYSRKKPFTRQAAKYALTGKVVCPACGGQTIFAHETWRCHGHMKRWECPHNYGFRPNVLENRVLDGLSEILGSSFETTYQSALKTAFDKETEHVEAERRRLSRELATAKAEYQRGLDSVFTDPRVAEDMQPMFQARAQNIDRLGTALAILPPVRVLASLADIGLESFADEISALRLRVPLNPEAGDGDVIRVLRSLIVQVRPRQLEGGLLDVEIDYSLGAVFGVDLPVVRKRYVCDAEEGCELLINRRRVAAERSGSVLTDAEFEIVQRLPSVVKHLDVGTWLRPVLDFVVTCLTTETTVQAATLHFGIPSKLDAIQVNRFRRSRSACDELQAAMEELRPGCVHALNRLWVKPRPSRTLRGRLEKIGHPFATLSFCRPREDADGYRLEQEDWEVVLRHLQSSGFDDVLGFGWKLRSDIGNLFQAVAENKLYEDVPGVASAAALKKRMQAAFNHGLFTELTRVLLKLDGDAARAESPIPDVYVPKHRNRRRMS